MKFRIWFNRDNDNSAEAWVISPEKGKQFTAPSVEIHGTVISQTDPDGCPQAWFEIEAPSIHNDKGRAIIFGRVTPSILNPAGI